MQGPEIIAPFASLVGSVSRRQRRIGVQRDKRVQVIGRARARKKRLHVVSRGKRARLEGR